MSPGDYLGWCDRHDRRESVRFDKLQRPYGAGHCSRLNERSYSRKIREGGQREECEIVTFVREAAIDLHEAYHQGWEDRSRKFIEQEVESLVARLKAVGLEVDIEEIK